VQPEPAQRPPGRLRGRVGAGRAAVRSSRRGGNCSGGQRI